MSILVINAGSSSLKFGLFDDEARAELASGLADWTDPARGAEFVVRSAGGDERWAPSHAGSGPSPRHSTAGIWARRTTSRAAGSGGRP